MRAAIDAAKQRFGALNGVVHAAGVPGAGLIELKGRVAAEAVLAPKLRGTQVLNELLAGEPLDFLVLCSSVVTAVVTVGQVDYVAANSFLNAFAQHVQARRGIPAISIGWDAWQEVGMAANTDVPEGMRQAREESLRTGIAPKDGCEAFRRLLWAGLPHVYVSPRDLPSREDYRPAPETEATETAGAETPASTSRTLARPALSTEYAAPSSETEEEICAIWGDLLGVDPVGVRDNFFELGGNSLVMMQLNVRLRSKYGVSLPMREIFETPQVASLAEKIESVRATSKPARREEFTL
jgi:acyl carrier protein/NAD(P)-dependent dehydrogenase (short-subunit alcohol dehydrogenase family)